MIIQILNPQGKLVLHSDFKSVFDIWADQRVLGLTDRLNGMLEAGKESPLKIDLQKIEDAQNSIRELTQIKRCIGEAFHSSYGRVNLLNEWVEDPATQTIYQTLTNYRLIAKLD